MKKKLKMILLVLIPILIDQIIKIAIISCGDLNIRLIPGVLKLSYVKNTGGAYGIGSESFLVLTGVNLLLIIYIIKYLVKNYKTLDKNLKIGLLLILSGGISNLIDRLLRGYVTDYIDVTELVDFPVFNIADSFIVIGVIIMMVTIVISTIKEQESIKKG